MKDFISEEDKKVLKHLKDLRFTKLDDGLVNNFNVLNFEYFY
jgi:hypothetical protein